MMKRTIYHWLSILVSIIAPGFLALIILEHWVERPESIPRIIGGYCAVWSTILALFQIMEHLTMFNIPEQQSKIIRILFMVPLYAMISFLSLAFRSAAVYLDLVRDAYESYALYNFFTLMLEMMGGLDTLYRTLMTEDRELMTHFFPFCYLAPIKVGPRFVQICHRCMFQFMVLKPLCTFIVIILEAQGLYGDSLLNLRKGFLWMTVIYNLSITIAFTALVYFYAGLKNLLEGYSPLGKFLCIKVVIFLSFWQGVVIEVLHTFSLLPKFEYWTEKEVVTGLQDFAICVEMLLISFAHKFCFGAHEYAREQIQQRASPNYKGLEDDLAPANSSLGEVSSTPRRESEANYSMNETSLPTTMPTASVWDNIVYTIRHEDVVVAMKDIWYGR